ncbi:WXG100 family type VII secretion target [Streptomyces sp. x-80]|uniref:WXG100 family type VII secretion target n=1 Tax=Streptomyces sp. x-80 TaxID=2789282 RepID=UPI003980B501
MAGDGFDVDTDQLKTATPTFHRESVVLERATAKLRQGLDGLGEPWGGDEQGEMFEHVYAPHRAQIEKASAALGKGLSSITKAMNDMAANHEDADRSAKSGLADGK